MYTVFCNTNFFYLGCGCLLEKNKTNKQKKKNRNKQKKTNRNKQKNNYNRPTHPTDIKVKYMSKIL